MKTTVLSGTIIGLLTAVLLTVYLILDSSQGTAEFERYVSPEQQLLVSDGVVSEEEYLQATTSMVRCLRAAGIVVSDPERGPQGAYRYRYLQGAASRQVLDQRAGAVQDCYHGNLGEVDRVWQLSAANQQSAEDGGFQIQRCVEGRKEGFRFSSDNPTLMRQVVDLQRQNDADFMACYHETVRATLAAADQVAGSVDIAFHPLPR